MYGEKVKIISSSENGMLHYFLYYFVYYFVYYFINTQIDDVALYHIL